MNMCILGTIATGVETLRARVESLVLFAKCIVRPTKRAWKLEQGFL